MSLLDYLLRSRYRWAIVGLLLGVAAIWLYWYRTEQIASPTPIIYASGVVLLNVILAFFAIKRQPYIVRYLFLFSYVLLILVLYGVFTVVRGVTL